MKTFIKLDRFFAWVLFATMLLYFISGYGMTKGLINSELATKLHNEVLTYIILIAFVVHSAFAIHLAFIRWQVWQTYGKTLWVLFYIIFIGAFVYVDKFYQPAQGVAETSTLNTTDSPTNNVATGSSTVAKSPSSTTAKTFTAMELSKYNGKNGNQAYVAVDGVVYDMTNVFKNGYHFGHIAGTELTNAFYTRHAKSAIAKYPVVGTYIK